MKKKQLLNSTILCSVLFFSTGSGVWAADSFNSNIGILTDWGPNNPALQANATDDGTAEVLNLGEVTSYNIFSHAIQISSQQGPLTVNNVKEYEDYTGPGILLTKANNARGIDAASLSGIVTITNDGSITTEGNEADAVRVVGGSKVNIDSSAGTLTTTGNYTAGILVDPNGSTTDIIIKSGQIVTGANDHSTGDFSHGILAGSANYSDIGSFYDVNINITAMGDIIVNGNSARGIFATVIEGGGSDVNVDTTAAHITTTGGVSNTGALSVEAIYAKSANGKVTVKAGNVSVLGGTGKGIVAFATGNGAVDVSTIADTKIITKHTDSSGIFAVSGGAAINIDLKGGIETDGRIAHGIDAQSVDRFNFPLITRGPVTINQAQGSVVTVKGERAIGIVSDSSTAQIDLAGRTTATGEYGAGLFAVAPEKAEISVLTGGSIMGGWQGDIASDPNTDVGTRAAGVAFAGENSVLNNNGTIGALSDRAVFDLALSSQFAGAFTGNATITNNGTLTGFVELAGGGTNKFQNNAIFDVRHFADTNGDGSRDTKRVAVNDFGSDSSLFENTTTATVKLGTVTGENTVDATSYYQVKTGSDERVLDTSFYDLNRSGIVQGQMLNLGTFSNAGIIDLRGMAVGNSLVISGATSVTDAGTGKFISNGGSLYLNTVLNAGMGIGGTTGSQSDVLVVDQTILGSGATKIQVFNVGGAGGQTPQNANGIQLVEVRDKQASADGVFILQGDYIHNGKSAVVGGAYAYTLYKNGLGADNTDGNWYLRSQLKDAPVDPVDPQYQAGVPVYEAYPQVLLALNSLPTLQQRVGNRYWNNAGNSMIIQGADPVGIPYAAPNEAGVLIQENGVWGRVEGNLLHAQPRVTTSGTDYNANIYKIQAGLDGLLNETDNGKLIGALTVHYGHAKADTYSAHGDGEISTDAYGFGGTLTWYGENGFYVDGQGQATWFDSDLSSKNTAVGSLKDGNNGFGYALSVETGKRISLDERWSVTPQAQLVYSNVDFDSFNDRYDAAVSLDKGDSLQGRLGLTIERQNSWQNAQGMTDRSFVYGIANLYYEFLDGTTVNVSNVNFSSRNDRVWGGIGAGGSYNWNNDKYSVYGEGLVTTSLNNFGDSYSYKGTIGLRVKW